jgi:hypothetical protein
MIWKESGTLQQPTRHNRRKVNPFLTHGDTSRAAKQMLSRSASSSRCFWNIGRPPSPRLHRRSEARLGRLPSEAAAPPPARPSASPSTVSNAWGRDSARSGRLGQVTRARIRQFIPLLHLDPAREEEVLFPPRAERGRAGLDTTTATDDSEPGTGAACLCLSWVQSKSPFPGRLVVTRQIERKLVDNTLLVSYHLRYPPCATRR